MAHVSESSIIKYSARNVAPSPRGEALDPHVDYHDKIVVVERDGMQFETLTLGCPTNPCVIVSPGGGATKENALFWARDVASAGLFVIMYDLRCTGGSQKCDLEKIFSSQFTDPQEELLRIMAKQPWKQAVEENRKRKEKGLIEESKDRLKHADLIKQAKGKEISHEDLYNPHIMEAMFDYETYADDAIRILDEFGIKKAHVMGLSQGGFISQVIAMLHPDRVLTCVSASTIYDKSGVELAYFTEEAAEFYKALKNRSLVDEDGNATFDDKTVTKQAYVDYKTGFVQVLLDGIPSEICDEMAVREWETGRCTDAQNALVGLAFEKFDAYSGKLSRHHEMLQKNRIPFFITHGRKDPIIHYSQAETLFSKVGTSVFEPHNFGHNFGPLDHQRRLLSQITSWMKKNATYCADAVFAGQVPASVGGDTYSNEVSADLGVTLDSSVIEIYTTFCNVQTVADTDVVFDMLLRKLDLLELKGKGLRLFVELNRKLSASGLNFKQKKLLQDLTNTVQKTQKVVAKVRGTPNKSVQEVIEDTLRQCQSDENFNRILVCGAGPVGLRAACECALLGFTVHVVEKRPNYSRANILTFWEQTMADILGLGAKSYFPDMVTAGTHMFLGTRQIQACLSKTLMLLGGTIRYGMEIYGLSPPSENESTKKWRGLFRPYVKHQRTQRAYAHASNNGEETKKTNESGYPSTMGKESVVDSSAVDFQKQKDYASDGKELADIDPSFLNCSIDKNNDSAQQTEAVEFDAYMIAEGGWSDSTRKLGFDKMVDKFKACFGLVINMKYNPNDLKEKNLKSKIHFSLSGDWPLKKCPIQAEFLEYLKGETHFFALVVTKRNLATDMTERHLQQIDEKDRDMIPESVLEHMRFACTQKGLMEMGVFREDKATGHALLAPENVDVDRLLEMAREITTEMGLPPTADFYDTNPVQLFDFSRRARCVHPIKVLRCVDGRPKIFDPSEFAKFDRDSQKDKSGSALVLPIGDALQEPNWTQGLGINRGFHTAMNQAFACLLAREKTAIDAVQESVKVHQCVTDMKWGIGNSGLAGSGGGNIGLKPAKEWNSDPRSRLPFK